MPALILLALLGWLAADRQPAAERCRPRPDAPGPRPAPHLLHYVTLPWYFLRQQRRGSAPAAASDAHPRRSWNSPASPFVAGWLRFGADPAALAVFCLAAWFLLTIAAIDFERRLVLNVMLAPAAVAALALSFLPGAPEPLNALLGAAAGFGLMLLIHLLTRGTLGAGDVKLAGVIGLLAGFPAVLTALLWGILLGGVAALVLILTKRAGRKTYIAYAPYLCLGALLTLYLRVL
jgi:leader peptidase (prepilin peptidase)/N-methyltransferase